MIKQKIFFEINDKNQMKVFKGTRVGNIPWVKEERKVTMSKRVNGANVYFYHTITLKVGLEHRQIIFKQPYPAVISSIMEKTGYSYEINFKGTIFNKDK